MKENKKIKINILTRTSNRPIGFKRCYLSVAEQSYKNTRHIVSYDDAADLNYLKDLAIDTVNVSQIKASKALQETDAEGNLYAPYNLYCNSLLDKVEDGWVLFLDDDDNLYHSKVLEELIHTIQENFNEDTMYIWQMRYPDGRVLPTSQQIKNKIIKKNSIGSPCYLFHSKYKDLVRWDAYKASDFRFLEQLLNLVPQQVFIPKVKVQINNFGDYGQRNDIATSLGLTNMPLVFYKNFYWSLIPKYHTRLFGKLVFHKLTYQNLFKKVFGISKTTSK